ncbi:hypothetical protein K5549_008988 [Capra hircus]|nr:hypothetical protein K5549_008988 [Capra hircus]
MTTKEMKVAKSRDQLALQPLEAVDLSPEQVEGRGFSTSKFVLPQIINPGMILSRPFPWMRIQSRGRPRKAGTQLDP